MQRKKNLRALKINLNKLIDWCRQLQFPPIVKKLYLLIIIKFQFVIESDVNTYEIYILRFKKIFLDNSIAIEINFFNFFIRVRKGNKLNKII